MSRLSNPKSQSEEVDGESKDGEGGGVEDGPVGRQTEGDVAKLKDLIEGEGKCEKGRPEQGQCEAEGGHGEEKYVCEDDEDVMKRNDAFPTKAREESNAAEFFVKGEGLKICDGKVRKGEKSQRNGDGEKTMCVPCLQDEPNGRNNICQMNGKEQFSETAIDEANWRDRVCEDDEEGNAKEEERCGRELSGGE